MSWDQRQGLEDGAWGGGGGAGPGHEKGVTGSHQAVLPPGPGSDLTSKQIGGVPEARSQMGTQRVREVRASRTRRSRASVLLCQSGLDEGTGELGARGFLELGQVMLLNRLDLNNVHWANICPRHQRSRRSLSPSLHVPADEVGPSGRVRGLQERGRLLPQETLVSHRGAPKEAQGAGTGEQLAPWEPRPGDSAADCPAPAARSSLLTPPPARANI